MQCYPKNILALKSPQQNAKPRSTAIVNDISRISSENSGSGVPPTDIGHDHGSPDGDEVCRAAGGDHSLYVIGEVDLAGRLERCMTARRERRGGDGWPYSCRSAACVWCRPPLIRSWWGGMRQWSAGTTSSLAIVRIDSSAGLRDGVRRLRRGLRDVRDRVARCRTQWRDVCCTGMAGGDHTALVMITHDGVDRSEVVDVLRRRWPEVVVKSLEQEQPAVAMLAGDAADLGRHRRGVEPLRIVILPQHDRQVASPMIEPMPVLV
jgi:hypothetical protein